MVFEVTGYYWLATSSLSIVEQITVQCHCIKLAPCDMIRGSATTDGRFIYFTARGDTLVFRYECSTEKWEILPSCP